MMKKLESSGRTRHVQDSGYLTRESWRVFTIMADFLLITKKKRSKQ